VGVGVREEDEERKKREEGKRCVRWGEGLGVWECSGGEERRTEKEEKEKKKEEGERRANEGEGSGRKRDKEKEKRGREREWGTIFLVCGGDVSAKRSKETN
jgi:hypothetical protein